ncbi:AAA family ATPase [Pseudomonas sp. MPFS]|uniref:AAA family ATPase n=1 Tax=Pseudomonas sp. MPFS TaxID=2795724 RepID=UPI001F12995C|nr:AAA family ATPase [Pseudomonas sp. MPFS]
MAIFQIAAALIFEETMLKRLHIKNFTVFEEADLQFSKQLNVIVGENGSGKTHLLKLAYAGLATSSEERNRLNAASVEPTKSVLQLRMADKLVGVFRPESLGRLARRKRGRERCDVKFFFDKSEYDLAFSFATNSKTEVSVEHLPKCWLKATPTYLPTRELLSIYPNFLAVYENHYLEFEETWRDTCRLLGGLLRKGPTEDRIRELLGPLETAMQGSIELDKNGRFYLRNASGRMEIPLVAEGLRKLGMLARLISTGALLHQGYLFWDEPEANLNPRLIKQVAKTIVDLSASGIQIFIATHSLFLLRELEILLSEKPQEAAFFGLHSSDGGITVQQGGSLEDIGDITALEESLQQSDRYLALE